MPAVTADTLTLPKLPAAAADAVERPVRVGHHRAAGLRGRGLPGAPGVRRRRPAPTSTRSSTWTRWARSTTPPGEPRGTDWHPHRGFETVTYMIDGTFQHQDSHGGGGVITNGATQWMTAGGGILHIETPPEQLVVSGGLFHGIQLWVNLPVEGQDDRAPRTRASRATRSRCSPRPTAGRCVRLIAGDVAGHAGPGSTHTPIIVAHATVVAGRPARRCRGRRTSTRWPTCWPAPARSAASGGRSSRASCVVFGAGDVVTLDGDAGHEPLEVLLLGGRPDPASRSPPTARS